MNILSVFFEALGVYKKDKWIGLFSMVPVIIGILFYSLFGSWVYNDLLDKGRAYIETSISSGGWGSFVYYILVFFLTIIIYFLISYTFVLVVSGIASPFNDIISNRVERVLQGKQPKEVSESFSRLASRIGKTLFNEIKKITFIIILNLIAVALSFMGFLAPVGVVISAILLAVGFLDYSWSRKSFTFKECVDDVKSSFLPYLIMGGAFLLLLSVPIVNLFILPFGVVYFTVLHVKKFPKAIASE